MKYKIIFLLFLYSMVSFAQKSRFKADETLYIWAMNGLNMRKLPDAKSEKIAALPYGEKVTVLANIGVIVAHEVEEFKDFKVKGVWLLVEYGDKEGFVFDGYLSRLVAPVKNNQGMSSLLNYLEHQVGKNGTSEFETFEGAKQFLSVEKDNFDLFTEYGKYTTNFKREISYKLHIGETSSETITFANLSLYEGYVLLKTIFSNYRYYYKNKLFEFDNNELCYFILKVKGKKLIINGGCNC